MPNKNYILIVCYFTNLIFISIKYAIYDHFILLNFDNFDVGNLIVFIWAVTTTALIWTYMNLYKKVTKNSKIRELDLLYGHTVCDFWNSNVWSSWYLKMKELFFTFNMWFWIWYFSWICTREQIFKLRNFLYQKKT